MGQRISGGRVKALQMYMRSWEDISQTAVEEEKSYRREEESKEDKEDESLAGSVLLGEKPKAHWRWRPWLAE